MHPNEAALGDESIAAIAELNDEDPDLVASFFDRSAAEPWDVGHCCHHQPYSHLRRGSG